MKEIKIGIIGCGTIALQHMDTYKTMTDCKVVAICDIDEAKLNAFGDKYGITRRFTHIGQMLREADIDSVDVCLHNNLHAPVTIEAMRRGKNVYCEKPMAGSWADAKAMLDASKETGKLLHIQMFLLYTDETRAARKFIENDRLGKIYHMRSYGFRRRGRPYVDGYATKEFVDSTFSAGGALFDMGVYHISQLLYLTKQPKLERITGRTYAEVELDPVRRKISGFNVEELGCGFANFEGGLTMDILESWAIHMNPFGGSFIAGSKGGLRLDPLSFHNIVDDMEVDSTVNLSAMHYRNDMVFGETETHYNGSQKHWVSAQLGLCKLLPTAEIALDTQLLQEGIYLSNRLGREVTADEIRAMSVSKAIEIPNLYL
jgi:predicted dehydrogenase